MNVLNGSLAVNWGSSLPSPAQSSLPVSGGRDMTSLSVPSAKHSRYKI